MFNVDNVTSDKERNGVWVTYEGSQFLVAHINSPVFQRTFTKLQLPHRKAIEKHKLDPEIQLDILAKAMAKGILLDWKDVIDNEGNQVKYSEEMAEKVLKGNSAFREFIQEVATDLTHFTQEEREALGKSAEKLSDGTVNGDPG